ncbi:MAG: GNAT family N-acetyltransferase [Flavobacterium sp.]|uniref:GNAT family N-acetyltransferase n=1 Tax=Flavobacterium sp. TaxID=239 RepID=UPI0011F6F8BA|nr:GNAT family N-acetyltransferase [Flavobacterium sp.]RZJ67509.1 MAG: GNAT family N-acetyltransferase [Flavobacterium sp.]
MQIRQAQLSDFETVYDFINQLENEIMDSERQRGIFEANLSDPNIVYLLAFSDEKAVGFVSLHIQKLLHHGGPIGEIQEMFVSSDARSLGVGKQLIDEIKRIAKQKNVLQLEVTSNFKRESAHKFYEREGFSHTHKKFTL